MSIQLYLLGTCITYSDELWDIKVLRRHAACSSLQKDLASQSAMIACPNHTNSQGISYKESYILRQRVDYQMWGEWSQGRSKTTEQKVEIADPDRQQVSFVNLSKCPPLSLHCLPLHTTAGMEEMQGKSRFQLSFLLQWFDSSSWKWMQPSLPKLVTSVLIISIS